MSAFVVEDNVLNEISSQLDAIAKEIRNQESQLRRVQNGIYSSKSLHNKGYVTKVSNLKNSVSKIENTVSNLSSRLNKIAETYRQYENRVVKEGSGKAKGKGSKWNIIKGQIKSIGSKLKDLSVNVRRASGALGCDLAGLFSKDPVNLANGNYIYEDSFFDFDTPIPWNFRVFYNSQDSASNTMGRGWRHSFEEDLQVQDNIVTITMEDASQLNFYEIEANNYIPISGISGILTATASEYQYSNKENTHHVFNKDGILIRIDSDIDYSIQFQYENSLLMRIFDTYKNEILFKYDEDGMLIQVEDHSGRMLKISYEEGNLISLEDPNGNVISYQYINGLLTKIVSNEGVVALENTYDDNGRTVKQQFPDGGIATYDYNDEKRLVVLTQQNGSKITYIHDDLNRAIETVYENGSEKYTYNNNNQRTSFTDRLGYQTSYEFNDLGNLTAIKNAVGNVTQFSYEDNQITEVVHNNRTLAEYEYNDRHQLVEAVNANYEKVSYGYDAKGQMISFTREDGSEIKFEYDDLGNVISVFDDVTGKTSYEYDGAHNVIRTVDALGNETRFFYDSNSNLVKVINAVGNEECYEYDSRNNLCLVRSFGGTVTKMKYNSINKLEEVIFPDGNKLRYQYDTMWNLARITDENGHDTEYQYDNYDNLIKIKYADGTEESAEYDPVGNLVHRIAQDGAELHFKYDGMKRRIHGEDSLGFYWDIKYNDLGKVERITYNGDVSDVYTYDDMGNITSHTDRNGYRIQYSYNSLGKLEEIFDDLSWITRRDYYPGGKLKKEWSVDGSFREYEYDEAGHLILISDENGSWRYEYDCLGQPIKCIHNDLVEEFSYDALGNLTSVQSNDGEHSEYSYNERGSLAQIRYANGGMTQYLYDNCNRIVSVIRGSQHDENAKRVFQIQRDVMGQEIAYIRPDGSQTMMEYDPCGREKRKIQPDGSYIDAEYNPDGTIKRQIISDGREILYKYDSLKQLSEIEDWLGSTVFQQDSVGNLEQVTDHRGNKTKYEYTDRGEIAQITYPNGEKAYYEYDESFRHTITKYRDDIYSYVYDEKGRLTERQYPHNLVSRYVYSDHGDMKEMHHLQDGKVIQSYQYSYDIKGRVESILEQASEKDTACFQFEYDQNSFLKDYSVNGKTTSYVYDLFGNRIKQTNDEGTTEYKYNMLDQLVASKGPKGQKKFTYDPMGNLTSVMDNGAISKQFSYDSLGRLARAECGQNASTYSYNALSMRTSAVFNIAGREETHEYGYDYTRTDKNLLYHSGNSHENVLWDEWILGTYYDGGYRQIFTDELMTPAIVNDTEGSRSCCKRMPFGEHLTTESLLLPLAFAGYLADPVTGFLHAYQREYDPENGRFTSRDILPNSIWLPTSMNEYVYCEDDPQNKVDFDGREVCAIVAAGAVCAARRVGATLLSDIGRSAVKSIKSGKLTWSGTRIEDYVGAAAGGFAEGAATVGAFAVTGSPVAARAAGRAAGNAVEYATSYGLKYAFNTNNARSTSSWKEFGEGMLKETVKGAAVGAVEGGVSYLEDPLESLKTVGGLMTGESKIIAKEMGKEFKNAFNIALYDGIGMSGKMLLKGVLTFGVFGAFEEAIKKAFSEDGLDSIFDSITKRHNSTSVVVGLRNFINAKCPAIKAT